MSAGDSGETMPVADIESLVVPRLAEARVTRVTLTGGEPFARPAPVAVARLFRRGVGICTNATLTTSSQIEALAGLGDVHVNVSLNGFAETSHGRFRGDRRSFGTTVETVRSLAAAGILQGLPCTPCGKGCPAAVISAGGQIGDLDAEQCPRAPSGMEVSGRLLPVVQP